MGARRSGKDRNAIVIGGARVNNLRDVSLRIPKDRLTVFTGVSGSGKSSVVFGTVAVESQRQLNETFSAYVRNRLPRYERPAAEVMENLTAAVVVDQRPIGGNRRSTVGTATDVHPVLRVLFSRHGTPSAGPSNLYSFNDPQGMCPECSGLGRAVALDLDALLHEDRSLNEGAIDFPSFKVGSAQWQLYAESGLFDPDRPIGRFSRKDRELLLHGSGFTVDRRGRNGVYKNEYEGVVTRIHRRYLAKGLDSLKERDRAAVDRVVHQGRCPACRGGRLSAAALGSTIDGRSIADMAAMEISELIPVLAAIDAPEVEGVVASALAALRRIEDIGLGYLSLDRETSTVSGGEGQRLKTVRHLGSSLAGVTYVFDEPSVGLHPRDVARLVELLHDLRDKGNTVLVVEHDRDVMAAADHVVDMGPGAGTAGGEVVFEGTWAGLRRSGTPTGRSLRSVGGLKEELRTPTGALRVRGADRHNLTGFDVDVPEGVLTAVTGVAGSGKSTLMTGVFAAQHPDTVVIDQSDTGLSPRSVPASYVGAMDHVRDLFAAANGVDAGLFSFNSAGACPGCRGRGAIETDLAYLDPVTTTCELCGGHRYRTDVLEHELRGSSIVDVLDTTADDALVFFDEDGAVRDRLAPLAEVGLGYLRLGQPLSTLSGGERQRLKLAKRLGGTGSVYLFDEPTTGLHMADVDTLLALFDRLVDDGNTVVVVEHDLDVVKRADRVIDLGPDAGRHGGRVVFEGTPAELARHDGATGTSLAAELRRTG